MSRQNIFTGNAANDGTGDTLRSAFTKVNANFTELYDVAANTVTSSGGVISGNVKIGATDVMGLGTPANPQNHARELLRKASGCVMKEDNDG